MLKKKTSEIFCVTVVPLTCLSSENKMKTFSQKKAHVLNTEMI